MSLRAKFWPSLFVLLLVSVLIAPLARAAATWKQPTAEELSMTSQPEVPGAPAVILYHEEITDDSRPAWIFYSRIKILNEAGREKYGTVAVKYPMDSAWHMNQSEADMGFFTVNEISGRTIHPDGTVIPFTGKAFVREVEKSSSERIREKVFTLPDVQIGSIIEFSYTLRYDGFVFVPQWYAQTELFARKQHFRWRTNLDKVAWTAKVPGGGNSIKRMDAAEGEGLVDYSLDLSNTMPVPEESYLPPLHSLEQRVIFYAFDDDQRIKSHAIYWDITGKSWSKEINRFIGSSSAIRQATDGVTADAVSAEEKLHKIYAAVMALDNTNFTREHSAKEDKEVGLSKTKTAADIWEHKRGTPDQLAMLFIAMARAAGLKAYAMTVVNRDRNIFVPDWLSLSQFDDDIAVVEINGKEVFLDPGERYCPFGELQWMHTGVGGLRQTETGTALRSTPPGSYKTSQTQRIAELVVDSSGHETGTVSFTYMGAPALELRQQALSTDEAELHKKMEEMLRNLLPKGTEVSLEKFDNLQDYEKPLVAHFSVQGPLATVTSKRVVLPSQIFQVSQQELFPGTERNNDVYFHFPERVADGVRLMLPIGWKLEVPIEPTNFQFDEISLYKASTQLTGNTMVLRRDYVEDSVIVPRKLYPQMRDFYAKLATKDQEPVLLQVSSAGSEQ